MNASTSFAESKEIVGSRRAVRPLAMAIAVTLLVTAPRLFDTVDSDVAWQLWIAGRLHAGAHLYRDIIEVNPPLWFWMALPVDALARVLGVIPETVLVIAAGALVMLSLTAMNALLKDMLPGRRALLLAYAALVLTIMPWAHVGQREHLVLIGAVPYAMLVAARSQGQRVPIPLAVAIGIGGALGFALKQYFLLVPVLLELWLLARHRRQWRPLRPETIAIAAVGTVYACAILLWAGAYLTDILPLIRIAYGATGAPSWLLLFGPFALLGLVTLVFTTAQWRQTAGHKAPFSAALLVAAAAFAAAYFLQAKGWLYHAIPLLGCASIALAALLVERDAAAASRRILSPVLLVLPLVFAAQEKLHQAAPGADLLDAVSGLRPGQSVGYLAVDNVVPWSVTLQHRLRYPSRFMSFWMLNAVVHNEATGGADPKLAALGRQIVSQTVEDFRCAPPERIVIARPQPGQQGFDILGFFLRDPQFAELMTHYKVRSWTGLETFELATPLQAPATPCRSGI